MYYVINIQLHKVGTMISNIKVKKWSDKKVRVQSLPANIILKFII